MFGFIRKSKIRKILNFDWEEQEFKTRPHTKKADEFWMREWFEKCCRINELIKKSLTEEENKKLADRLCYIRRGRNENEQ